MSWRLFPAIHQAARRLEEESGLAELPLTARDILATIAGSQSLIRATDLVQTEKFGTPPTVYKMLAELQMAGWIRVAPHPAGCRANVLKPTPRTARLYARIGKEAARMLREHPA